MSTSVKFAVKTLIWRWLQLCAYFRRTAGWARLAKPSLVLVPCDPYDVVGSRGDEAMIYAVLADFRMRHPDGKISVVVSNDGFASTADGRRLMAAFPGIGIEKAWGGRFCLLRIYRAFLRIRPSEVYVLGADCMDGYYSSDVSFTLLASVDLAFRLGARANLTGFSFNDHPTKDVTRAFRHLSSDFVCNVRDPISLERFRRLVPKSATSRLVADVAFVLKPEYSGMVESIGSWCEREREQGRIVLAFNLHGMLVGRDKYDQLVKDVGCALAAFLEARQDVSILLVPHDYRPQGDIVTLTKIHDRVDSPRMRLVNEVLGADELKGLMRHVDGLFTSRMHLGIAALGEGKPICSVAYQGKFLGLYGHFCMPERYLLQVENIAELDRVLGDFVSGLPELKHVVESHVDGVRALSRLNLNGE